MIYSKIKGCGSYLPEKILTNSDLESTLDTTDEWITTRTGIKKRHIIGKDQFTSDLALEAAKIAIKDANLKPNDIDLIIVATTTPDKVFPSTACILQKKLGIIECPAFDIQAVCSGFIYALSVADKFIKSSSAKNVLVVGADAMSRITDYSDRSNAILWGDGSGAIILSSSDDEGILSTHIHAKGEYGELLHVPKKDKEGCRETIEMKGNQVFKMAVNTLDMIVDETLNLNNLAKEDIDWVVPHQANIRILEATAKKLNMSMDKVIVTIDHQGNTSAASIPLALDFGIKKNKIKPGHLILMEAFGGGFTWGSALIRI
ncbi:MAG: ketoacyl-ACP synthase III [Nitrosomonadales bacterium]|jgi:3-oxoacyl-[acyl-carrier-protein] synthase-3|nr:ketoacyl-ACP synthase III [Nitrosomonadales bacterium]MBT3918339.1 ketoacyl-ACP synthase III [Nitrosomonadales bacterium]MBT4182693.1 ketoacyl-ACP synthase III [Nitrosomonadales bacterium]MBT6014924.1 ketoacyl-ACP synthase III [Nitrosomonadales bacterium]MBT6251323.1 ketoacyl-ACP synthase III [Nitrosomonadales bacterium]